MSEKPTYIIADIAGNYLSLMALIDQFEQPCDIVSVGDLIDRGPRSKEVVEYFMAHPEIVVCAGNHEDLLLNDEETWLWNGGDATLKSFNNYIPDTVRDWMGALPWSHTVEAGGKRFYISHTFPPNPKKPWPEKPVLLWNRQFPVRDPNYDLLIAGHNSQWGLRWFEEIVDNKPQKYAVCIDDSHDKKLTAIELPSLKIIQQDYID